MQLTLLLSENTAMDMGMLLLLAPLVLVLLFPLFWLSRPKSSDMAKLVALGLALLIIWFSSGLTDEFGYMEYAWLVSSFFYLPLGVVLINLVRSIPKSSFQ